MSEIRAIIEGTAKDYDAFTDIAKRACAFVEENEPGILSYECFTDETSGRFLWKETYQDAAAFLTHGQHMSETGIMDEVTQVVDFDRVTILDPVPDAQARGVLAQMGAIWMQETAQVQR